MTGVSAFSGLGGVELTGLSELGGVATAGSAPRSFVGVGAAEGVATTFRWVSELASGLIGSSTGSGALVFECECRAGPSEVSGLAGKPAVFDASGSVDLPDPADVSEPAGEPGLVGAFCLTDESWLSRVSG